MMSFNDFLQEGQVDTSTVVGNPEQAANTHKSIIRTGGGVIHKHTEKDGVHIVVHSSKSGVMRVSDIKPGEKKNSSVISTRKATDFEKKANSGKFIVSDKK